jgi:hypothetical protein
VGRGGGNGAREPSNNLQPIYHKYFFPFVYKKACLQKNIGRTISTAQNVEDFGMKEELSY